MSVTLVHALFLGAAIFAAGLFVIAYRRDLAAALAGIPLLLGGAGIDMAAATRFAASTRLDPVMGQEMAVLLAVAALALVALGAGLAAGGDSR